MEGGDEMIIRESLTPKLRYIIEIENDDNENERDIMWSAIKNASSTIKEIQKIKGIIKDVYLR